MSEASTVLQVKSVEKEFSTPAGTVLALREISFELNAGESIAITGPSGSGKTTLLNIVAALDRPTRGLVTVHGTDVAKLEGKELQRYRAKQVGLVFQEHRLLPELTAIENVQLPTLAPGCREHASRAAELLERVGVSDRATTFAWKLSGGERQRVAIARALVNGPRLLLCDEPTGNLDAENARAVAGLLLEVARESNVALVIVTHNPDLAGACGLRLELRR